jgi:hypothetical protein
MNKDQLIITALQQRIGELVSIYETQNAMLRAELTQLMEEINAKEEAKEQYSNSLNNLTN